MAVGCGHGCGGDRRQLAAPSPATSAGACCCGGGPLASPACCMNRETEGIATARPRLVLPSQSLLLVLLLALARHRGPLTRQPGSILVPFTPLGKRRRHLPV